MIEGPLKNGPSAFLYLFRRLEAEDQHPPAQHDGGGTYKLQASGPPGGIFIGEYLLPFVEAVRKIREFVEIKRHFVRSMVPGGTGDGFRKSA